MLITKLWRIWATAFLFGISASASAHALFQDYLGLDGYIQYVRTHWVNLPLWVSITNLAFIFGWGVAARRRLRQSEATHKSANHIILQLANWVPPQPGPTHVRSQQSN
jgi:hypothetical protein